MTRRWSAALAAAATTGLLTCCGPQTVEPGIPADTAGPLTRQQAEQLIEEPLADLAGTVSQRAGEYAEFSAEAPAEVAESDGRCLYVSTTYRSTQQVDSDGWGELADAVRPQMEAWEMGTERLEDEHRAIGAGLRGQNPHNQAELSLQAWNGHLAEEVDGPTMGLEMTVRVPLADSECGLTG